MAQPHATIPLWTAIAPAAGLAFELLLHGSAAPLVGVGFAVALIAAVLAAVHHAELLAHRVGEPFGAVILALAVTVIEAGLIISILLGDKPQPTLVRDTIYAVVVIVLHGIAGLCIVVGAWRYREQRFRAEAAHAYLIVLLPMVAVTLVLPNFTTSAPGPYYTPLQLGFVSIACLALYLGFTFFQTVSNRDYFIPGEPAGTTEAAEPLRPSAQVTAAAAGLLLISLTAVVLLAKSSTPFIQAAANAVGAPDVVVGFVVAAIVLLPETLAAVRAAAADRLQTSINLALGSAVASIGLTIPLVAAVAWWTGTPLELGVSAGGAMMLGLTFMMALITYGTGRASFLSGFVHLVLFAVSIFLLFAP